MGTTLLYDLGMALVFVGMVVSVIAALLFFVSSSGGKRKILGGGVIIRVHADSLWDEQGFDQESSAAIVVADHDPGRGNHIV
jgi:hypothetical protein